MSEFKVGDEDWRWRTKGYHAEIQIPSDLYLLSSIVDTFYKEGGIDTTDGEWLSESDLRKCFHTKQEAIDAMISHIQTL